MTAHSRPLDFEDDIPIPEFNLGIYRRLYVLERWLRRIALAALQARHGDGWWGALPDDLSAELKKWRAQLPLS